MLLRLANGTEISLYAIQIWSTSGLPLARNLGPKRTFVKARVKYTVNGASYSNLQLITLELLMAGDVELNPGHDYCSLEDNIRKLKLLDKGQESVNGI